ncbi:hypothetical protein A2886_00295 [candidate division WWE3 bacterium RIFCSPHIGHO2_01_FULL_42_13]|uniref:Uncharacterized protein n=1 Tax=candidate division WWE3 bacterium RIFCSPHIGHO2_01_FULL_42_13 TaxID=1802617 RepID=A0A1F4UUD1_UNCKA|nr:MAG: hypothetical protein A2886_00295 [candidate division WWE3 bacterium RIFCSPHIGHO2_01_FULL_42_13]
MNLTTRIQKLSKPLPELAKQFSSTLTIEADDVAGSEKKGTLYAAFDVSSNTSLDPLLVTKIVHDVLHDSYYTSEIVSPIQSLEKSIVAVKDKVTELSTLDFNIIAAALWGNVLYMVQFGKGGSFLVREGVVKSVNSATEGNFSEASGVVRSDDVVIIGTQSFIEKYNPNDLVTGSVSFSVSDLPERASALLIKFDEATSSISEEKTSPPSSRPEPTLSIARKVPAELPKIILRSTRSFKVKPAYLAVIAILVLLGGSIIWTVQSRNKAAKETAVSESTETTESVLGVTEPDVSKDEEFKISRIDPEAFYDIKIVDAAASPTDITVLDSSVVVVDQSSGKVFTSSTTTPKFVEEGLAFPGIKSVTYWGGDLAFVDNEGYKVYSEDEPAEVLESYAQTDLGPSHPYLAFVYAVVGDTLNKYEKSTDVLDESVWAQSSVLQGAISLAIDGNIYVLKSDGSLLKFYTGEQVSFEVTGLDKGFLNPTKVVKDVDLVNIYVADSGNNRVVVLDEAGNLVKQFVANGDTWNNIRSIGVSRDETTLFVLSGSKVYEVAL